MVVWNIAKLSVQNGIVTTVYFTESGYKRKKVQLEMKDSCKATQRDEKQLMKKWIQGNFFCLVRALWKCTESLIEIMQIRYVLADFELSYFLPK